MLARLLKLLSTMTGQDSITSRKCSNNRPSSATASTSSARPALQEIPKNPTKSNAKKRRMQSSCRIPTAPRALMQPSSHPLPISLPAVDASDGEEARMGKKRKWEDGGSEQYDFGRSINEVLRGMQAADRMAKMERRRDQQIRDFQYAVEELRQRNEELQAQMRESEAKMDAYRVDLLKEREERTALVATKKKTHILLLNECRAYMIRYDKLLAEKEVTESRQLETQRALEAKLQKSQNQLKQLESTSRAAETNLTLENENLQTLVSELELKNATAQASIDEQAQARAAIDVERETERQAFSTRETKLMRRIDELIRTTKSMRANIAKECNTDDREAAQMSLKEDYELRLRKVKESADERVKKLQEEFREMLSCRTDYTRTNAEPAGKGSDIQVEASQPEQDPQLSAAPRGPAKWKKHKLHTTSDDKNADRLPLLHTKETEITSLQRVNKNLTLQVSAASKQIAAYSDLALRKDLHIEQQIHTLADRDLAIRHLRSRNIAMKWHISAIKSQRVAALTSQSTTQSECETQVQEIKRLRTLLQTSELAQIQAETAQAAQDVAMRHLRSRNLAMKWYLAVIKFQRAAAEAELELPLAVEDETYTLRSTSTTPPPSALLLSSTQTAPPKSLPPTTPNNELAAAAALKKNSSTCSDHEKCAVEKKWLDERYHDTWISNRGLVDMVEKLRSEMAGMRRTCCRGCYT